MMKQPQMRKDDVALPATVESSAYEAVTRSG